MSVNVQGVAAHYQKIDDQYFPAPNYSFGGENIAQCFVFTEDFLFASNTYRKCKEKTLSGIKDQARARPIPD